MIRWIAPNGWPAFGIVRLLRSGYSSQMNTATITEAKNGLSALIDRVRAGETIVLLDRGVPVARLEPVATLDDPEGRLRRLERMGVIRRGSGATLLDLLEMPPPSTTDGSSITQALLDDRRDGR